MDTKLVQSEDISKEKDANNIVKSQFSQASVSYLCMRRL